MLNQTPTSHQPHLPPIPPPILPKRKRGGQPGNRNAHKHGFYAKHNPHPLASILPKAKQIIEQARENPETIAKQITALRQENLQLFGLWDKSPPNTPSAAANASIVTSTILGASLPSTKFSIKICTSTAILASKPS